MDPIENQIREIYQSQKRDDEQSTPDFETFFIKAPASKPSGRVMPLLRMAAALVVVVSFAFYYFFRSTPARIKYPEISRINVVQPLPTQILDYDFGTAYLWDWKAPTDKLLENAKSHSTTNKKI